MILFVYENKQIRRLGWLIFMLLIINLLPTFAVFKYNADSIQEPLKINADAVIREYSTTLEIESIRHAKKKVHYSVTILNKAGEHFGVFNETYHKFLKVENFSGNVYDASGRLVKELKKSDFNDLSAISGYTLFDDTRRKYLSPITNFFPYTIEYDYEIIYEGLFYYPTWYPISSYNLSCENSKLEVVLPKSMNFRYKEAYLSDSVAISNTNENKIYTWEINNVQAFVEEKYSPGLSLIIPSIRLAPNVFEIDGYYGNQQTWQNFGIWVKSLNQGKENLNPEAINEIKTEIGELSDTLSIIKEIYKYVQSRTRYVNLKLGIGGYQPIDAQTVHNVGYGDCKALTNYTKSILDVYGIKSYYTLVQAGEDTPEIQVDFPSAQFNHAFLSVPYKKDTIWLECTSQTNPFGYIGNFTDNRQVLLITENGGELANTPSYNNINQVKRLINFDINKNGDATATIKIIYQGANYSEISEILEMSPSEQKKWMYNKLPFSSFEINSLEINRSEDKTIQASIHFDIKMEKYASISNKRIFIPLLNNFEDECLPLLTSSESRLNDIIIRESKNVIDSIVFSYPEDYNIEYLPESNNIDTSFGNLEIKVDTINANQIAVYSSKSLNAGRYEKESYNELVNFSAVINKNKNLKAVLVKKETPE